MKECITAKQFIENIETMREKYKLVNGLFIVKYFDDEFCYYYGEFLKSGSALNPTKTNRVLIQPKMDLKYNKSRNIGTTTMGVWKPLSIAFVETSIKEILK